MRVYSSRLLIDVPKVTGRNQALHDRAIINCEYSMATFSTGERKKKSKGDRYYIAHDNMDIHSDLVIIQIAELSKKIRDLNHRLIISNHHISLYIKRKCRYMALICLYLSRRSTEISLLLKQTFEAAIMSHLFPRSQIDIFVQVLQADGGK